MRINLYASGLCSAFTHSCETWTMTESVTRTIIFLYKHMAMGQFSKVFRNPMNRPPSRLPQIVPAPHRSIASSYQKEGFYNSWNQSTATKRLAPTRYPENSSKRAPTNLQVSLQSFFRPRSTKVSYRTIGNSLSFHRSSKKQTKTT